MKLLGLFSSFVALASASPAARAAPNPVVDLGYAQFKGITDANLNVSSWYGLYYAASPEGALRWASPVDIEKKNAYVKSAVYNATAYGPQCYQESTGWMADQSIGNSENCLLLNVHKPVRPVTSKLPVLVFIHGGGYDLGSAQDPIGSYFTSFARSQVIFVQIQYRLGGFGFLNSKEIREHGTANAGLLDQRSALQWVQRHIGAFGGDPSKVTITGQSAGGGSVSAQLQLYGGVQNPPFRAAVAEYPWYQTFHTEQVYNKQYSDLLAATQCQDVACLRALPYVTLTAAFNRTSVSAYQQKEYAYGDFYWGPGVDGTVIKELPHTAFDCGRFSKVPLLIDRDAVEGWAFTKWTALSTEAQVTLDLKQLWPDANNTFFNKLEALYPTSYFSGAYLSTPVVVAAAPNTTVGALLDTDYPGLADAYKTKNPFPFKRAQIFGDGFLACSTRTVAAAFVKHKVPVWKLIFNSGIFVHTAVSLVTDLPVGMGVAHNSATETDYLRAYMVSFATDLDPNKNPAFADVVRPTWAQYGVGANVLYDNFTNFLQGVDSDKSPQCQFMLDYADQIRN